MLSSKCTICSSKKSSFIKKQEASGILSSLGFQDSIIWWYFVLSAVPLNHYKMNEMAKKNVLAVDKFISEMHLKQPKFTYSSCGPFKETTKEYKIFEETGDSRYIYIKMN